MAHLSARPAEGPVSASSVAFSADETHGIALQPGNRLLAPSEALDQFVIRRRVERALALQTGFASQSHLSEVFRRLVGETPGAFRRSEK